MVDALHRAHRWLRPNGCVIDLHPASAVPTIDVGRQVIGEVHTPDGPARHAAADAALRDVIAAGFFVNAGWAEFEFYTWADTLDELREHIEDNWRDARLSVHADATVLGRPRACERVRITKLFVASGRD